MTMHPVLSTADYVIAAIIITVPVSIGVWFAIRDINRATRDEYLLGGGKMSMLPTAMSLFVTFQSAVSMIGMPAESYFFGCSIFFMNVGTSVAYIVGYYTIVPLMYPLRLTSVYEYLLLRYKSKAVRYLCTVIGMLGTTLYMAIALLSPALVLEASAGVPLWMSIALMGAIGTIYTAIGGIKSVIWTDAFQTVFIFIGLFSIIIKASIQVGGLGEVWRIAEMGGRTTFDRFTPDPRVRHNLWGLVVGCCFMWLVNCFNQSSVQRLCSMQSLRDARRSFLINVPFMLLYGGILTFVGFSIYAYFSYLECGPFESGKIANRNQIAPYYVLHSMVDLPGMSGLFIATISCGALSTLSSGINALAANTVEDFLQKPLRQVREATATLITKVIVLLYGALIIGLAYLARTLKGPVTQMSASVFGALGSPVLGIFITAATVPWANKYGALSGGIIALIYNLWICVCGRIYGRQAIPLPPVSTAKCHHLSNDTTTLVSLNITNTAHFSTPFDSDMFTEIPSTSPTVPPTDDGYGFFLYDVSYEWYSLMGTTISIVVGLVVSYLTRSKIKDPSFDSKLIFPFLRKFWDLPETTDASFNVNNTEIIITQPKKKDLGDKGPFQSDSLETNLIDNGI